MKISNYILFILGASIILSSCSSLSISQKRYSRGLNIDWFASKDKDKETPKTTVRVKKGADKTKDNAAPASVVAANEVKPIAEPQAATVVVPTNNPAEQPVVKTHGIAKSSKNNTIPSKKEIKQARKAISQAREQLRSNEPTKTHDVSTAILVILCLFPFLGALAIFLHDGEINDRFVISLLLYLLFWLPGVVYSILCVLDVI